MASTLIARICDPWTLTRQQRADIAEELDNPDPNSIRLHLYEIVGLAQEILAGRKPASSIGFRLTTAEKVDGQALLVMLQAGDFTVYEFENILLLGTVGNPKSYSVAEIEAIFGLT